VETEFARTLLLGVSIGQALNRPAQRFLVPAIQHLAPPFAREWVPRGVGYACRLVGAVTTYSLLNHAIVGAIYAGAKGGHLLLDSFLELCETHGVQYLDGHWDEVAAWSVVVTGVAFQVLWLEPDGELPFVIDVVLFPFWLLEVVLLRLLGFLRS